MAFLHGHHVGNVLHYKSARLQEPDNTDKLLVEAVAGIVQIARPDLAEALTGRSSIDYVYSVSNELIEGRYTRLSAAALAAGLDINREHPLEALRP